MTKILILGGTGEGQGLAHALTQAHPGFDVITSLAGATATPRQLPGSVRVGGFGGVDGLADFITDQAIDFVIDATHPFAQRITRQAVEACGRSGAPYLRLDRPQWTLPPDTDVVFVPDATEAARLVARTSGCALLTIGRKDLDAFQGVEKVKLVVRVIDQPADDLGLNEATFITGRPPFSLNDEVALMREHQVDTLVTKASGGDATRAKIDAAAQVGARIVLLRRPPPPDGERVLVVDEAVKWIEERL